MLSILRLASTGWKSKVGPLLMIGSTLAFLSQYPLPLPATVRSALGRMATGSEVTPARSDFVRFAQCLKVRAELEEARDRYNRDESQLRGDALLEAQDRLRELKTFYKQHARSLLLKLRDDCKASGTPLPAEAAKMLAEM